MKCPGYSNSHGHTKCSNDGCTQPVTASCFNEILVKNYELQVTEGEMFCTKNVLHNKNKINDQVQRAWDKDGRDGPYDLNHSLLYLIAWMTEPGN